MKKVIIRGNTGGSGDTYSMRYTQPSPEGVQQPDASRSDAASGPRTETSAERKPG